MALTRREAIAAAAVGGGALLLPGGRALAGVGRRREAVLRDGAFAHGVAAGLPREREVTLWTRVDGIERSGRLTLEVARDAGFSSVVERREVRAAAVRDFTVHARVKGLEPGERYWYRFEHAAGSSPVGSVRTARPADSAEPIRIGFFSCQRFQDGYYTAHRGLAQEDDLDLVVSLGDYVYERNGSSALEGRNDASSRSGGGESETLADYRAKYALYRSDRDLQAMHAAHGFAAIWDDHEVEDNWAGTTPGTTARSRRTVAFETRKANGLGAFFEWLPIERIAGDRVRIYRNLRLGAHAELFCLDTRSYRDDQPCGDSAGLLGQDCDDATRFDPRRTLLGAAQKQWFVDAVSQSTATWKVVANQMMVMGTEGLPGRSTGTDNWDGYAGERAEVLGALRSRGAKDIAFVTGDVHTFYAGTVTTTGRGDGTPVATEFVGGSITSGGPRSLETRVIAEAERLYRISNPHWTFTDFVRKGYGVLEARPDELRVWFRSPRSVTDRQSEVRTIAAMRVGRGSTDVEVLSSH